MIRRNKMKIERRIEMKKYVAEFIGTFVLVFFGTGIAVVSNGNLVATALAFGLAIIAEAYVIGNISGCHVNPAVSLAMLITGKMKREDFAYYVIAQILGAFIWNKFRYSISWSKLFWRTNFKQYKFNSSSYNRNCINMCIYIYNFRCY